MKRFILAAMMLLGSAAHAEHGSQPWSVGLGLGQGFPDTPSEFSVYAEKDWHGAIWINRYFTPYLALGLDYNHLNFKADGGGDNPTIDLLSLDLTYRIMPMSHFTPLATVGAGWASLDKYSDKDGAFGALARVGVEYAFDNGLALGAHAQYTYTGDDSSKIASETHTWSYLISLGYAFGGDSSSSKHEETPAPKKEVQPEPKAEVAATPAPMADEDNDGVPDAYDKCPGTPAGQKVNAVGCPEKEPAKVELKVLFASGKTEVDPSTKGDIEKLAEFMKAVPNTKVVIEGHTDSTGSAAANKKISQERADAVRKVLVEEFGVEGTRVSAKGFGSSQPVASNKTADGRKKNRRVVANITK